MLPSLVLVCDDDATVWRLQRLCHCLYPGWGEALGQVYTLHYIARSAFSTYHGHKIHKEYAHTSYLLHSSQRWHRGVCLTGNPQLYAARPYSLCV